MADSEEESSSDSLSLSSSSSTSDNSDDDDNIDTKNIKNYEDDRPPVFIHQMPAISPNTGNQTNPGQGQRTTFRPPWVKESPSPLPMPSAPWTARAREANSQEQTDSQNGENSTPQRKQSKITIIPSKPGMKENGHASQSSAGVNRQREEKTVPIKVEKSIPISIETKSVKKPVERQSREKPEERVRKVSPVPPAVEVKMESNIPPPPKCPMPPPPPPPIPGKPPIDKQPLPPVRAAKLEALRSRPRRRPDWTDMMKEVEQGAKLKHVQCNDRSAPILPKSKAKGQFVYESEKDNAHNQLLKQIQHGVRLKKVKTNDRSRPNIDGLRKFRRQMTIEEQIQKSTSVADVVALAAEPDELDDIDKVRDDLQSAKQMLALELRNKEGLERENKRLMARLLNLEAELEKEKATKRIEAERGTVVQVRTEQDEKLIQQLKEEATEASAVAKDVEQKYQKIAEELDTTRAKLESAWLRNQQLEMQLKAVEKESAIAAVTNTISKQPSSKKLAASMACMPNGRPSLVPSEQESEYEEETEESETEDENENEKDAEAAKERRSQRELKMMTTKVRSFRNKMNNALKERHKLKDVLSKQQKALREEKKKYKLLQKEVDKMAKLMKDCEDEEAEEEEEDDDKQEEETETESESEESEEEEEESDDNFPDDMDQEEKKKKLEERSKRFENRLGSLKKGNYLLKANIDRLQDDLNRQKEMSLTLQEDLNSVLAELG